MTKVTAYHRTGEPNTYSAADRFRLHRLAMLALEADPTEEDLRSALRTIKEDESADFADALMRLGVASYWHHFLLAHVASGSAPTGLLDALKSIRLSETMLYMAQSTAMKDLDSLFESKGIAYALIKGAHVREVVYDDPALRSAGDIDVLVSPAQRKIAVHALIDAGYTLHANPENISHEATLTRGDVAIDLHWDVLRPGRTRIPMAEELLSRRQRQRTHWGLSDTDTVFLMLTHPAFAKYVCSPNMGLNRVFDLVLWLRRCPADWDSLGTLLARSGLNTAAWTMLQWVDMLQARPAVEIPAGFLAQLRPGTLRGGYLRFWLRHDLPTRWLDRGLLIQIFFTLFLHDRPSDAWRAMSGWLRSRRMRHTDLQHLSGS
jgi:hypothetical protein